jgi:hypothetical protein
MDTFDPQKVTLVIAGNIISGFGEGSFITASREEDTWLSVVGSDGRVARARNANKKGIVQFTLLATAPSNDVCSALHNLDELTGIPPGAFQLVDQLGRTVLSGDESFFMKPADVEYDKTVTNRQWSLVVPKLDMVVGGSL